MTHDTDTRPPCDTIYHPYLGEQRTFYRYAYRTQEADVQEGPRRGVTETQSDERAQQASHLTAMKRFKQYCIDIVNFLYLFIA